MLSFVIANYAFLNKEIPTYIKPYLMSTPRLKYAITLGIADDHKLLRQTLRHALSLEQNMSVVLEAEDGLELIRKLDASMPDVLLLDLKMPNCSGVQALRVIKDKFPELRVLIFTAYHDEVFVAQCLEFGVNGFLTKNMDLEEIIKAITLAYHNQVYTNNLFNSQLLKKYIANFQKADAHFLPEFSKDELAILELLKQEKTTQEVSEIMNLSKRSIELKRDKMREKTNTKTIAGLLIHAMNRGLID